jgi:hypothetical protein
MIMLKVNRGGKLKRVAESGVVDSSANGWSDELAGNGTGHELRWG